MAHTMTTSLTHNEKVELSYQKAKESIARLYPQGPQCPTYECIDSTFEKFNDHWPAVRQYLAEYNARWLSYLQSVSQK